MDTGIDLGVIWASIGLKLDGLTAGRALATSELRGISQELGQTATAAETASVRIGRAADNKALQSGLKEQEKALGQAAEAQKQFAKVSASALTGVSAGVTLAGVSVVKMAADFQSSMVRVANNTTLTTADIGTMKAAVISLGKESGASFDDLAQGFAHITNFGFKAADATVILREAMKSAVATGGSTSDTADILAKSLHEFGMKTADAGKAMNVLHLAAAEGNLTLEQFDQAAGPALGAAANLGVSFTEASAAMSALTRHGYDAAEAVTQVKDVFAHLLNPTDKVHEELARLSKATGVDLTSDFTAAGLKARGLYGIFVDLAKATKGHSEEVYKLIPAMRGGQGAMVLAGTGAKDYTDILRDLNKAMSGELDPSTVGYQRTLRTLNNEIARVANEIRADFIPVGEKLTPVFEDAIPLIHTTAHLLGDLLDGFAKLPKPIQETAFALGGLTLGVKALSLAIGTSGGAGLLGGLGSVAEKLGMKIAPGTVGAFLLRGAAGLPIAGVLGAGALAAGEVNAALKVDPFHSSGEHIVGGGSGSSAIVTTMMDKAAKGVIDAGKQCGSAISLAFKENGVSVTATALRDRARKNPQYREQPIGVDSRGAPRYHEGTIFFFPKAGFAKEQHFAMAHTSADGQQDLAEYTKAGTGKYHYQDTRPLASVLYEHGGLFEAFNAVGYGPKAGAKARLPKAGGSSTPADADTLADLKQRAYEASHTDFQNQRYEAKQQYAKDKSTDPALAKTTYLATLKKIDADEEKERAAHHQKVETAAEHHNKRMQALQAENLKSEAQATARVQKAGAIAAKARADAQDQLDALQDPDGHGFAQERETIKRTYRQRMTDAGAGTLGPYNQQQLSDFALAGQTRDAGLADVDSREKAKGGEAAAKVAEEADEYTKQAAADTTQLNREVWQHAGGDMAAYFKSLRDEADAALAEVQAKYGVGSATPNPAAVTAAQGAHDAKYAVIGQQQVDAAKDAQDQIERGQEESARFEFQQHMISLGQYRAILQQKLAATQQFTDASHTVLSEDYMRLKADYDQSMGESKARVIDVGQTIQTTFESSIEKSIGHFHSMKSEWKSLTKDMLSMAIEMIAKISAMWLTSKLFKGAPSLSFGGGASGGGGNPLGDFASILGAAKGGTSGSNTGAVPATTGTDNLGGANAGLGAVMGVMSALNGLPKGNLLNTGMGAMGQIQGINGAIGGFKQGGAAGALSGLSSILPMLGHGGLLGGVLGHGGLAGMFAHGGLMTGGGALGGLGAAMPWIGGGLMLNKLLGNPFGKMFKKMHLFSGGGIVPGHGFHDTVPAMLTPGEVVQNHEQQKQAMGNPVFHINHYGDNHGVDDVNAMHQDWAMTVAQNLTTATPGN